MKDDTFLARWLAGELNDVELEVFRKSDPERYSRLLRIKQQFETIEKPQTDTEAMLQAILSKDKNNVIQLKPRRRYWLQSVAAAAVVIILGLVFLYTRPEQMEAANGATLAFLLPDASAVELNSGSEAVYNKNNWDESREITLEGEAYFKVAKGKKFTVITNLGNIVVTGTRFNVKARGARLDVICYEGSVKIEHDGLVTALKPQEAVYLGEGSGQAVVKVIDAAPAWLQGEIIFYHESLQDIAGELERKFDVKVQTQYTSDKTFTGALPANNLSQTLKMIELIYPVKAEIHNKTIILKPADAKR